MQLTPPEDVTPRNNSLNTLMPGIETQEKQIEEVKDSRYTSLDEELPSKFAFYDYESLSIRPFTLMELKKLYRAYTTSNFKDIVDVIGATIDRNVLDLTVGDFWFMMYWQRLNSYKKSPMTIPWDCESNDHVLDVELERKTAESLHNVIVVNKTSIKVIDFNVQSVVDEVERIYKEYGIYLFPGTIRDVVSMIKLASKVEPDDDWIAKYATNISQKHGVSIQDRMSFLEGLSDREDINAIDFIFEIEAFAKIVEHGVRETIQSTCKECGADREITLSLDAHSFFPAL